MEQGGYDLPVNGNGNETSIIEDMENSSSTYDNRVKLTKRYTGRVGEDNHNILDEGSLIITHDKESSPDMTELHAAPREENTSVMNCDEGIPSLQDEERTTVIYSRERSPARKDVEGSPAILNGDISNVTSYEDGSIIMTDGGRSPIDQEDEVVHPMVDKETTKILHDIEKIPLIQNGEVTHVTPNGEGEESFPNIHEQASPNEDNAEKSVQDCDETPDGEASPISGVDVSLNDGEVVPTTCTCCTSCKKSNISKTLTSEIGIQTDFVPRDSEVTTVDASVQSDNNQMFRNRRKSKPVQYIQHDSDWSSDEDRIHQSPNIPPVKLSIPKVRGKKFRLKLEVIDPPVNGDIANQNAVKPKLKPAKSIKKETTRSPRISKDDPGPYPCAVCGQVLEDRKKLKYHRRAHKLKEKPVEKTHFCETCNKGFRYKQSLVLHTRSHTGEKPFKCEQCGKFFSSPANLLTHRRLHTGIKPFVCRFCGHAFRQLGNLQDHERLHTGDKPHICEFCGKAFTSANLLKRHRPVHTGERNYVCSTCGRTYLCSGHLREHTRLHTGEKPYLCSYCGKAFRKSYHLKMHYRVHSGEKPCVCEICGTGFALKGNLNKHMKQRHNMIEEIPSLHPADAGAGAATGVSDSQPPTLVPNSAAAAATGVVKQPRKRAPKGSKQRLNNASNSSYSSSAAASSRIDDSILLAVAAGHAGGSSQQHRGVGAGAGSPVAASVIGQHGGGGVVGGNALSHIMSQRLTTNMTPSGIASSIQSGGGGHLSNLMTSPVTPLDQTSAVNLAAAAAEISWNQMTIPISTITSVPAHHHTVASSTASAKSDQFHLTSLKHDFPPPQQQQQQHQQQHAHAASFLTSVHRAAAAVAGPSATTVSAAQAPSSSLAHNSSGWPSIVGGTDVAAAAAAVNVQGSLQAAAAWSNYQPAEFQRGMELFLSQTAAHLQTPSVPAAAHQGVSSSGVVTTAAAPAGHHATSSINQALMDAHGGSYPVFPNNFTTNY